MNIVVTGLLLPRVVMDASIFIVVQKMSIVLLMNVQTIVRVVHTNIPKNRIVDFKVISFRVADPFLSGQPFLGGEKLAKANFSFFIDISKKI